MRLSAIPDVTLPSRILKQLWPQHHRLAPSNVMAFAQGQIREAAICRAGSGLRDPEAGRSGGIWRLLHPRSGSQLGPSAHAASA